MREVSLRTECGRASEVHYACLRQQGKAECGPQGRCVFEYNVSFNWIHAQLVPEPVSTARR
jgi:hypothetical protein